MFIDEYRWIQITTIDVDYIYKNVPNSSIVMKLHRSVKIHKWRVKIQYFMNVSPLDKQWGSCINSSQYNLCDI